MMQIHDQIKEALEILDLPTLVTKSDIKKRYKQLAREHHPDLSSDSDKSIASINYAYTLLMEYIESFRYTFDKEEISRQYPGAEHAEKFKP